MLKEENFAVAIALINGILFDKHKILENSELDVYYEALKYEINDEYIFIESVRSFIKEWPSAYKRPSPFEIINFYKKFKQDKETDLLIEQQIQKIKKLNLTLKNCREPQNLVCNNHIKKSK